MRGFKCLKDDKVLIYNGVESELSYHWGKNTDGSCDDHRIFIHLFSSVKAKDEARPFLEIWIDP